MERSATVAGRRLLLVGGEAAALLFAFAVVALKFLTGSRIRLSTRRWLLTPMLALTVWQIISLAWNDPDYMGRPRALPHQLFCNLPQSLFYWRWGT